MNDKSGLAASLLVQAIDEVTVLQSQLAAANARAEKAERPAPFNSDQIREIAHRHCACGCRDVPGTMINHTNVCDNLCAAIREAHALACGCSAGDAIAKALLLTSTTSAADDDEYEQRIRHEEWQLVPVEPTNDMICSALQASLEIMAEKKVDGLSPFRDYPPPGEVAKRCYRAMLAAAPRPDPAQDGDHENGKS